MEKREVTWSMMWGVGGKWLKVPAEVVGNQIELRRGLGPNYGGSSRPSRGGIWT